MGKEIRQKQNRPILVLDINNDPGWEADYITDDPEKYLIFVKANRGCQLFIDESGESIGRYAKDMMFLATRSRHFGHVATFIGQRAQMIDRNVRDQCSRLFLFSVSRKDAETFAEDWVDDGLHKAYELERGKCLAKLKFKPIVEINAFNLAKTMPE